MKIAQHHFAYASFPHHTSFNRADKLPLCLCCRCLATILCYSYSTWFCSLTLLTPIWGALKFLSSVFSSHRVLRVHPQVLIRGERGRETERQRQLKVGCHKTVLTSVIHSKARPACRTSKVMQSFYTICSKPGSAVMNRDAKAQQFAFHIGAWRPSSDTPLAR